jgi:hypothetical protein
MMKSVATINERHAFLLGYLRRRRREKYHAWQRFYQKA